MKKIKFIFLIVSILFFLLIIISFLFMVYNEKSFNDKLLLDNAKSVFNKDSGFRKWIASHGGVYVKITERTPPNPRLSHIKDRDVNTTSNQQLTLMNPAYALRQYMDEQTGLYGEKGKITSLKLLNHNNAPDRWERKALQEFRKSKNPKEFYEKVGENLRYIKPMIVKENCLKCHGHQGYKLGDTRGGVSVTIPLEKYKKDFDEKYKILLEYHIIIWTLGMVFIYFVYKMLINATVKQEKLYKKVKNHTEELEKEIKKAVEENSRQNIILQQQSKVAAMGEMIGNIAHQWRQPLNKISIEKELLIDYYYEKELNDKEIENFNKSITSILKYMSSTIDDFRHFFMPEKEKIDFEINESVEGALNIISSTLSNNAIKLNTTYCEPVFINGYTNEFKQVIINIINNAKDILVEKEISDGKVDIEITKKGSKVLISISDNGGGIPDKIIDKVFEPYFTTKFKSQGTGIGLYMSKVIIEKNMGGKLTVKNSKDGASFEIELDL